MSNATSAAMSNESTAVESKKGSKYYFDKITLTALKAETVIMAAVMLYCAYLAVATFVF